MTLTVGHRGAADVFPENTLKGFRYAVSLGVDYTECDVHLTHDGRLVVMHDDTVDRTTDGTGRIRDMDFEAIRRLDAGGGEQIPTLDEVLETVRGKVKLLCELKGEGVEDAAVDAVAAAGLEQDVSFTSFQIERIRKVKQRDARLQVRAIFSDPSADDIARAVDLGVCGVDVHYRNLCLRTVEQILEAGIDLIAWNPNTHRGYRAMIALGAPIISTNRPDLLVAYLKRKKERHV